jgi:AmmeMemoRadiSam system protein B/AmmeMemoRadiSam system protein A
VAGLFYPRDAGSLAGEIKDFLDQADADPLSPGFPKIVIAPHAGFIYSGAVAASAYDLLRPARGIVRRVVLLGPCHRVPVRGMALPAAGAFDTPLGRVSIDAAAVQALRGLPEVIDMAEAHAEEHSIEVHLPFLQHVLGQFSLVPLVVGRVAVEQVARALDLLWGGQETLVVISSDLSHYLRYDDARALDTGTAQAILGFDPRITHDQACGATPIGGAMLAAKRRALAPRLLDLRNSGDTAGGRSRVVGYGSFAFSASPDAYGEEHGHTLLALARLSIGAALGLNPAPQEPMEPWMCERRATFVTLKQGGRLRGCIGALEPARRLGEDVIANARAAALADARFSPVGAAEFRDMRIELSVLSRPVRLAFEDHAGLIAQLVPGEDGLILECGPPGQLRRGTFLPQVWGDIADPEQFITQLKRKAGIPADTRSTRCTFRRYRVRKWSEAQPAEAA